MKTVKVYAREILERTGYKAHPYKKQTQYIVLHNGQMWRNQHLETLDNARLRIPFVEVLNTRSIKTIEIAMKTLGKTDAEKWLKVTLKCIVAMHLHNREIKTNKEKTK